MSNTSGMRFTKEHEWVKIEGQKAYVGVTDYAQKSLGNIVFVELPEIGSEVASGNMLATIESVKTVSDVYAPLGGKVMEVNGELENDPGLINSDAYGTFIAILEITDASNLENLMDEAQYQTYCEEEH